MPAGIVIRDQAPADFAAVHQLVIAAFRTLPVASGTEQFIMDALWRSGAAAVALVAEDGGAIIGQVAFSKVLIGGRDVDWHGCGPLSVAPARHKQGIGSALMRTGLDRLRVRGSKGCVLVGNPDFYRRFGFASTKKLKLPDVPPEVFLALPFGDEMPRGKVMFDKAFAA